MLLRSATITSNKWESTAIIRLLFLHIPEITISKHASFDRGVIDSALGDCIARPEDGACAKAVKAAKACLNLATFHSRLAIVVFNFAEDDSIFKVDLIGSVLQLSCRSGRDLRELLTMYISILAAISSDEPTCYHEIGRSIHEYKPRYNVIDLSVTLEFP
jgi:hypothetical protein